MSTQTGYFLIADITGYTAYLSATELEHAQQTLTALLNVLIHQTKPPLIISRLAGDAVISYALTDTFVSGQTFAEMIEDTYVAFRRRIELMVRNTSCKCNACRNIGALDLKFFVHAGQFGIQKLDAHDELVGSDVILIHRLLKNHVTEATGIGAYALYTDAALNRLGLETAGLLPHDESYDNFGTVTTWIEDMHPVWERKRDELAVRIMPRDTLFVDEIAIAATPEQVWGYLVRPESYNVLVGGDRMEIAGRAGGRVAVGSVYQCYHGEALVALTVLEWRPFERLLTQFVAPVPIKGTTGMSEVQLVPVPGGTRLVMTFSKAGGPLLGRLMANAALKTMRAGVQTDLQNFRDHVEADLGTRPAAPAAAPIPAAVIESEARASLMAT